MPGLLARDADAAAVRLGILFSTEQGAVEEAGEKLADRLKRRRQRSRQR